MKVLENLGFRLTSTKLNGQTTWRWNDVFKIINKPVTSTNHRAKTIIQKQNLSTPLTDKTERILYQGQFVFDNENFALELLKNIGIIEYITHTKVLESKSHIHISILTELGFHKIEQDTWTKGIFLISLQPPKWGNDRGKVIILRKPNLGKLKTIDRASKVVYKGRYFFDDREFTNVLLDKIGYTLFDTDPTQKNADYLFIRDKVKGDELQYKDKAFLNF